MPREHVEFVQSQAITWKPTGQESARPGVTVRTLSKDGISGASSNLLQYPAGWVMESQRPLSCDEELFVLDGCLSLGAHTLPRGSYAYLPAGYPRKGFASPEGAIVLSFFEGPLQLQASAQEDSGYDPDLLVGPLDTDELDWGEAIDRKVAGPRVGRKLLRPDSPSGERTWILSMSASEQQPIEVNGVEQHPCVEEMYLLAGDFTMPCGLMRPGAYFWRPPMIKHGPMGTKTGFMGFFRAKEGRFSTQWSEQGAAVPWGAPYEPVVPAGMVVDSGEALDCDRPW